MSGCIPVSTQRWVWLYSMQVSSLVNICEVLADGIASARIAQGVSIISEFTRTRICQTDDDVWTRFSIPPPYRHGHRMMKISVSLHSNYQLTEHFPSCYRVISVVKLHNSRRFLLAGTYVATGSSILTFLYWTPMIRLRVQCTVVLYLALVLCLGSNVPVQHL